MKKFLIGAIACFTALSASPQSFITRFRQQAGDKPAGFRTENVAIDLSRKTPSGTKCSCEINVDYPAAGPEALLRSARAWICDNFDSMHDANLSLAAFKSAATAWGKERVDSAVCEVAEMESDDYGYTMPGYEYDWTITNIANNQRYVSFEGRYYMYMGGAHGMSASDGVTFTVREGKALDWNNMFRPGYESRLRLLVIKHLMSDYFDVGTYGELSEYLFCEADDLQLPSTTPYFTDSGIKFVYGEYEIAPYSSGRPECVVPFRELASLLSPLALSLIK